MTDAAICPCDQVIFPIPISNVPGQNFVAYRVGTYADFRRALLRARPGEVELVPWSPTPGDLGLQLVEWFAYLAEVLTFYNEQAANNTYLRTAFLPGTVQRLVRVLGYRPRPGIGAKGVVGAIVAPTNTGDITIPVGFALQSKPNPAPPQVFELDGGKPVVIPAVGTLPVHVEPDALDGGLTITMNSGVLLRGVVALKPQERLLFARLDRPASSDSAMVTVDSVATEKNDRGAKNTRVKFDSAFTIDGDPASYALFRSAQSSGRIGFGITSSVFEFYLPTLVRSLKVGDPVATLSSVGDDLGVRAVTSYSETLDHPSSDTKVSLLHSVIELGGGGLSVDISQVTTIEFGFRPVANVIRDPVTSPLLRPTSLSLTPDAPVRSDVAVYGAPALVIDADGNGVSGRVASDGATPIDLAIGETRDLTLPLSLLFAVIPVSRGKTVTKEIVGSGDATIAGQVFTLQKSPLTYFPGPDASFPSSTLRVSVDGVAWKEVPSFYDQPADARVFVTRETTDQKTQLVFGDGVNGARLPTGKDNVVADYRYGSGRASPPAGTLTNILKPVPSLRSVKNPIAVSGGDDPQPAEKIREYAPASVLTFGRAISATDYEAIAAQAPAVTRAKAYYTWSAERQRALVKVYVGDDDAAVTSARTALDSARDRNQPLQVLLATQVSVGIAFSLVVDADYDPHTIQSVVNDALLDPDTGLFSPKRLRVGEHLYESRVVAACLAVPGAVAVHQFRMSRFGFSIDRRFVVLRPIFFHVPASPAFIDPGEGGFCSLSPGNLSITTETPDG
jgi:hypothetical protein